MSRVGYSNPLAFKRNARGGVLHPFDGLPIEVVGQIGVNGISGYRTVYFNHMDRWEGPAGTNLATTTEGGWTATIIAAGAGNAGAITVRDSAEYGVLRLTTDNAAGDNINLQLDGSSVRYRNNKRMVVAARLAIVDADATVVMFGLALENLTDFVAALPTDGIFFEKAATATNFDFQVRQDGTSTENTAALNLTLTDNTFVTLGFLVTEAGHIRPFTIASTGTVTYGTTVAATNANIPDDEDLALFLGIETSSAAGQSVDVDWMLVAVER